MDHISHDGGVPAIVLLVDDDTRALAEYGSAFEQSGLWVETTDHGEAFETAAELKPNLIVSDADSGGRGHEFAAALGEDAHLHGTPLIMLAGGPTPELERTVTEYGAIVLVKPVLPATLVGRARPLLTRRAPADTRPGDHWRGGDKPTRIRAIEAAVTERLDQGRRCPGCGARLEWVEHGTVAGV